MNKIKNNKLYSLSIFLMSLCILLFYSCASVSNTVNKDIPIWINSPSQVYEKDSFLFYVGYGQDRNDAEISALNGLSSIFEQSIQVNTEASTRMTQAENAGIVATSEFRGFSQDVLKQVNVQNLTGVEIKEYWFSEQENKWYAIAVLDKKLAAGLYKTMMIKNAETINDIIEGTKKDLYSIQSYCAYDFAQEIAIENKKLLDRLYVIDYILADSLKDYVIAPADIAEKKMKIAKEIPIAVIIEGDNDGKIASAFLDAFKQCNFMGSLDKRVRYIVTGVIKYDVDYTRDGSTTKCLYDLESFLFDTKNDIQLFPINVRGRQSHTTYEKAKLRAESAIMEEILTEFSNGFSNYLSGYSEK